MANCSPWCTLGPFLMTVNAGKAFAGFTPTTVTNVSYGTIIWGKNICWVNSYIIYVELNIAIVVIAVTMRNA